MHEGQELAVVEAMKMQNSLHAGLSGTVSFKVPLVVIRYFMFDSMMRNSCQDSKGFTS